MPAAVVDLICLRARQPRLDEAEYRDQPVDQCHDGCRIGDRFRVPQYGGHYREQQHATRQIAVVRIQVALVRVIVHRGRERQT